MDGHGDSHDHEQRWRAERRAWIATHHPDRGGDPVEFAAGLAELDARRAIPLAPGTVSFRRSRGPWHQARRWIRRRRRGAGPPRVR